jgi:hypothetical protein
MNSSSLCSHALYSRWWFQGHFPNGLPPHGYCIDSYYLLHPCRPDQPSHRRFSGLYEKVRATASENYVSGNIDGSLLTFKSKGAIVRELILKFENLALVVMVRVRI